MRSNRKLGKQTRAHNNIPHLSQVRRISKPNIPQSVNYLTGMPTNLGAMLNDKIGDCSIAGLHHARQVWTFNSTNNIITDQDKDVLEDYRLFCGYDPHNPDTDQGGILQNVLNKAVKIGISTDNGKDHLSGFVEVDPRIQTDIKETIAFGGVAYIGINLPEDYLDISEGGTWGLSREESAGGHCVILAGYDQSGFDVVSWGMHFKMTYDAFHAYCDEAYWLADSCWIEKTGLTPGGMTLSEVQSAMQSVKI